MCIPRCQGFSASVPYSTASKQYHIYGGWHIPSHFIAAKPHTQTEQQMLGIPARSCKPELSKSYIPIVSAAFGIRVCAWFSVHAYRWLVKLLIKVTIVTRVYTQTKYVRALIDSTSVPVLCSFLFSLNIPIFTEIIAPAKRLRRGIAFVIPIHHHHHTPSLTHITHITSHRPSYIKSATNSIYFYIYTDTDTPYLFPLECSEPQTHRINNQFRWRRRRRRCCRRRRHKVRVPAVPPRSQ